MCIPVYITLVSRPWIRHTARQGHTENSSSNRAALDVRSEGRLSKLPNNMAGSGGCLCIDQVNAVQPLQRRRLKSAFT